MDEEDTMTLRYANYATMASSVLDYIDQMRDEVTVSPSWRSSFDLLVELLLGVANGAQSIVAKSQLSPDETRSLEADLRSADLMLRIKPLDPAEVNEWSSHAIRVVKQIRDSGVGALGREDEQFLDGELDPLLEALAGVDGFADQGRRLEIEPVPLP